jgi:hypothetical protein
MMLATICLKYDHTKSVRKRSKPKIFIFTLLKSTLIIILYFKPFETFSIRNEVPQMNVYRNFY